VNRASRRRAASGRDGWERFEDSEYLRELLARLSRDGWARDLEADELIRYCVSRFSGLARKHRLEPDDARWAAFEAMRNPSARNGTDPWAVIVKAVAVTMRAAEFARPFRSDLDCAEGDDAAGPGSIPARAANIAAWLRCHGWGLETARVAVEVVMLRLAEAGSRPAACEQLRKDRHARAITGLPARSCTALLRLLLGAPGHDKARANRGKGVLLRLALGEAPARLDADAALAEAAAAAAPKWAGRL
jgi:hypothetical protein